MKISIIMAVYNAQETIEQAIKSVINQNYQEKELIIIDGGSTDETVEIIKRYEEHLAYWCSEPDKGVYDAMNKGLLKAKGEVIAFLNSDDWYEENIFVKIGTYFLSTEAEILVGKVNCVLNGHVFQESSVFNIEDLRHNMIFCHQGMFAARKVFQQIGGFNLNYKIAADYEWTLNAYTAGFQFMLVEDLFANYNCDGLSSVQLYQAYQESEEIAWKHITDAKELKKKQTEFEEKSQEQLEMTFYHVVLKKNAEFARDFFEKDIKYYLWGTGYYGRVCCKLFWKIGREPAGFIDNNRNVSECYGYPVYSPEEMNGNEYICICSKNYEDEINEQIRKMGYRENQILRFSRLRNDMVEFGKRNYADYVMK